MLVQQTLLQLRALKLKAMAEAYEGQLSQPSMGSLAFDDRMAMLVDAEQAARENRKLKRLLASAKMPEFALREDIDYRSARGLDKAMMATLMTGEWVRRHQNVLLVGPTGTGKTWVGCALAGQMCRQGCSALYRSSADLFDELVTASADGSLPKLKRQLLAVQILMIDDLGLAPLPAEIGHVLLSVVDQRSRTGSLIITSQFPVAKWHGLFPDPTLADAILDRIVHRSHEIRLKGESMRKLLARDEIKQQ